jgi:hypothetical protein
MKERKGVPLFVIIAVITLYLAGIGWADVPAPPANQSLGFKDTVFNNLTEADCRVCHDDPGVVGPTPNADRHHMIYGDSLRQGKCLVNRITCLSDADCNSAICSSTNASCDVDGDCLYAGLGETCGEVCIGETVAPNPDASSSVYGCLTCHDQDTTGGVTNFLVPRDCLQCHVQATGEGSVHHLNPMAQGFDSPLGDPNKGDCTPCHGTIVDDIGDGHLIPTYTPSMMTPEPIRGDGLPLNSRGNGAGACDYCHDSGTDTESGVQVLANDDTHHNTGVFQSETGVQNNNACQWCHNVFVPNEYLIRTCEGCHGYESLHNIQANSDGNCSITTGTTCNTDDDCPAGETCADEIVVGGELYGYGHVGRDMGPGDSDCWGCHGFGMSSASAPGSGPTNPTINGADPMAVTAGTATQITVTGAAFTNISGATAYTSDVVLTAADGSSVTLTPDAVTQGSLTVTIPETTAPGNYSLKAVKGEAASNPVVIIVKPPVAIADVQCQNSCAGSTMTINGSGFRDDQLPEGAEDYINVELDGIPMNITFWTDTQIEAASPNCGQLPGKTVTVNGLFGTAISQQ